MTVIGVDPGKLGAYAVIIDGKLVSVTPFNGNLSVCRNLFVYRQDFFPVGTTFYIEYVTASPQMGVVSAFTFGRYAEAVETAAVLTGLPVYKIRPQVWQEALGVFGQGDKQKLYEYAKQRFSEAYKNKVFNKSSADSVLIALYGYECERRKT